MTDVNQYYQRLQRQLDLQRGNLDLSNMSLMQQRKTVSEINSQGNAAAAWLKRYRPGGLPQENEITYGDNDTVSINDSYFERLSEEANKPSARAARIQANAANRAANNASASQNQQQEQSKMQVETPYFDRTKFNYPTRNQGTQLQMGNQTFRLINYADGGHELFSPQNTIRSGGGGLSQRSVLNELKALGVDPNTEKGQKQYQAYMDALKSGPTRRGVQNTEPAPTAGTFLTSTGSQSVPVQGSYMGQNYVIVSPTQPVTNTSQQMPIAQNNNRNSVQPYQIVGSPLNTPTPNKYPTNEIGKVESAWKRMFGIDL